MDFLGTWRTRDGRVATIKAQDTQFLWGEMPEEPHPDGGIRQFFPLWFSDGSYAATPDDEHPLDLMERISDRWGAKEGE